ncbi:MAG: hypothetical protein IT195_04150 [Microthrixaceae bacterium]|nr:hypothetical protein [Microthrixaceae bacterium]
MASPDPVLSIACDDCVMAATAACDDCLVSYLCSEVRGPSEVPPRSNVAHQSSDARSVVLDLDEHRAVRRLQAAGLLPRSRHRSRVV